MPMKSRPRRPMVSISAAVITDDRSPLCVCTRIDDASTPMDSSLAQLRARSAARTAVRWPSARVPSAHSLEPAQLRYVIGARHQAGNHEAAVRVRHCVTCELCIGIANRYCGAGLDGLLGVHHRAADLTGQGLRTRHVREANTQTSNKTRRTLAIPLFTTSPPPENPRKSVPFQRPQGCRNSTDDPLQMGPGYARSRDLSKKCGG